MDDEERIGITIDEIMPDEVPSTSVAPLQTATPLQSATPSVPKLIFVIPYRDRKEHLEQFRRHMKVMLEDMDPSEYRFLIVHQRDTRSFNRGAMKNIGFIRAARMYPNDYRNITFVFNDVDCMPMRKNMWDYTTKHGVVKHFYGFDYTLGGIVCITGADYERIGGFPNYWGWGYEDNELQKRVEKAKIHIDRSIFYHVNDMTNIIQLSHGLTRVMNRDDFERFTVGKVENLYTIVKLEYTDEPSINTVDAIDIEYVNVWVFQTGYEEVKTERFVYNLKNGSRPIVSFKRKNGNPQVLMKFL